MKKILLSLAVAISAIGVQAQTRVVVSHPRHRVVVVTRPVAARPVIVARPIVVARPLVRPVVVRPVRRRAVIVVH